MIRLALCHLLGGRSAIPRLFPTIGNCALTEIRMIDRRPALLRLNVPVEGSARSSANVPAVAQPPARAGRTAQPGAAMLSQQDEPHDAVLVERGDCA